MARLTLNGVETEAPDGAPLVEVIKRSGVWISNLCYLDGLAPYAGCRSCLVEIEGARGLQLSCTSRVSDGMVVRTDSPAVVDARKAVISIIDANHADRCLNCHRRIHCMPGDICLRDSVVTHRCLTCAKNYRCELQTTNEMAEMASYEPWTGEARTYYQSEQPEADRANPFLEFDPQMCIVCTRCVRACDEIRHTGAITLAGRGPTTRIAFGAGGAVHESACDFCGACIDVCPTATLMEKPNKWIARSEAWVSTACNSCSVGCTLSMAVRNGKIVMVKPDRLNPVSDSQICVRGRFHYDAVKPKERLTRHLVRQAGVLTPTPFQTAIEAAADRLAEVIREHGPAAVGVMVAPWATNEEAYLAQKIARQVIGTESIDSTAGPLARAVADVVAGAFGTDVLPADLSRVETASTILVLADDLESSHNVVALRVKDAVVRSGASLIVISARYGEVCDFIEPPPAGSIMPSPQRRPPPGQTGIWLRPAAGAEVAATAALGRLLGASLAPAGVEGVEAAAAGPGEVAGVSPEDLARASSILQRAASADGHLAVIYAPNPASPRVAAEGAKAAANLSILCRGEKAAESLYVLPTEANVNGITDMGVRPGQGGLDAAAMPAGVRALIVVGDNPAMFSRGRDEVRAALEKLDCLVTIDSLQTDTAKLAHVAFADLPTYGKDGTYVSADRRVVRLSRAESPAGDQRDCLDVLSALAQGLASRLGKSVAPPAAASAVMSEICSTLPGFADAVYNRLASGVTRALPSAPSHLRVQAVQTAPPPSANGRLVLATARTLFTSLEGASIRSPEADKLHREDFIELNPADASALGIAARASVVVANGSHEVSLTAVVSDAVAAGSVFLPLYLDGGVVNSLMPAADEAVPTVSIRRA